VTFIPGPIVHGDAPSDATQEWSYLPTSARFDHRVEKLDGPRLPQNGRQRFHKGVTLPRAACLERFIGVRVNRDELGLPVPEMRERDIPPGKKDNLVGKK